MRRRCCCADNKCSAQWTYTHNAETCETEFTSQGAATPPCTVVSEEWEFSDGDTASGNVVTHTYDPDSPIIPPWAELTVTTSCGHVCKLKKEVSVPCQDSIPPCYPSAQESLPNYWRVDFSGMYVKGYGSVGSLNANITWEDPFNRFLCLVPPEVPTRLLVFGAIDLSVLNGSWEIPYHSVNGGFYRYVVTAGNVVTPTYSASSEGPPLKTVIRQTLIAKAWINVYTDFNCDSIGPLTRDLIVQVVNVFNTIGQTSYMIANYTKEITLPAGVKLKNIGPVTMDPVPFVFGTPSTEGRPFAWEYAYNNPDCRPSDGALPIAYPTCIITPNG